MINLRTVTKEPRLAPILMGVDVERIGMSSVAPTQSMASCRRRWHASSDASATTSAVASSPWQMSARMNMRLDRESRKQSIAFLQDVTFANFGGSAAYSDAGTTSPCAARSALSLLPFFLSSLRLIDAAALSDRSSRFLRRATACTSPLMAEACLRAPASLIAAAVSSTVSLLRGLVCWPRIVDAESPSAPLKEHRTKAATSATAATAANVALSDVERADVEQHRDLAFAVAVGIGGNEGLDDGEFVFASILLLLRCLPDLHDAAQAHTLLAGRIAAAAAASTLYKFFIEGCDEDSASGSLLTRAGATWRHDQLKNAMRRCETVLAFRGNLFSTATDNVLISSRGKVEHALRQGRLDKKAASGCRAVAFYVAFHCVYEVNKFTDSVGQDAVASAISLSSLACAHASGYHASLPEREEHAALGAQLLERVAKLGTTAQSMVGGVFDDASRREHFMTSRQSVADAARSLRGRQLLPAMQRFESGE